MSYMCCLVALGNPNFMESMDFLHLKTMSANFILFIKYEELHYCVGHHYYQGCKFDSTLLFGNLELRVRVLTGKLWAELQLARITNKSKRK